MAALDQKLKTLGQNSAVESNHRLLNFRQNEQGDVMGLLGKRSASGKVQKEVTILNKLGLNARPAAMFVRAANKHRAEIWVEKDGEQVNGKKHHGPQARASVLFFGL